MLLMERLDTNLHDYLCNKDNENAELSMKQSILLDVVNGLVYLHCQIPVIIHRDLTARNVLLDKYLNAKISDFGNARMMTYGCDMTPESMTSLPGTRDYMPPEAMDNVDEICYDTKLDVFSFGHLALFCGIQRPIIPLYQTYYDSSNEFCYRSELERRDRYMTELKSNLGDSHALIRLIIQCLDDDPDERPSTETLRAQMKCLAPVKELDFRYMNDIYGYLHLLPKPDMLQLGLVLGLNYSKLTGKLDTSLFHQEVIAAWLRKEDYVTDDEKRRPTWANLVAALRNDTVRQNGIANLIYQHEGLKFFI